MLLIGFTIVGCGKSDSSRVDVWGAVTWQGKPVPDGFVVFNPDTSLGNSGPQGVAWIDGGRFDTRTSEARGSVVGPQKITVHGYDGQNISALAPYGSRLFEPYEQAIEVPSKGGEFDIVVPDDVKASPMDNNEYQ